jgi:hypothetical protein
MDLISNSYYHHSDKPSGQETKSSRLYDRPSTERQKREYEELDLSALGIRTQ